MKLPWTDGIKEDYLNVTLNDEKQKLIDRERDSQQRIKELSTLYEVSKVLTSTLELDDALKLIVETTANMMGVKACGLRLHDKLTGEMLLKAVYGLSQEYIHKGRVFVWKGLYKDVIYDENVAIVDDVAEDPRLEYIEEAVAEGIVSMLSVGLVIRGETVGTLSVYTAQRHAFGRDQIRIFKGIANEASAVIERALLYEECIESQRMEQELDTAASIQTNLMPQEYPRLPGYQIAARNIPSRMVGGDFYDFITFDESHMGMVIADVSGKGIPGAILMASARASLRAYLEEPHSVESVITRLNNVLCRDTQPDQFVSLFYGMLDIEEEIFTYVNAGHNPPILFRDHEKILMEEGGPILGVLQDASYQVEEVKLLAGDVLLLYTDGITEAERGGEYFEVERLMELVEADMSRVPEELLDNILEVVSEFGSDSRQTDDRTLIVLKKER
ncbi:SpoIIE family protein phosphatase [Candidatus Poribacteria bacterium]